MKTDLKMPAVSIAGGGVMGLSVAHRLNRETPGHARLFDISGARALGESTSAMAGGMLAPYSEIEYLPEAYIECALQGVDFWERLSSQSAPGIFHRSGTLIVAHPHDAHLLPRLYSKLKKYDVCRPVEGKTLTALEPSLSHFTNGLFIEREAHLDTGLALRALAAGTEILSADACKKTTENNQVATMLIDCRGYAAATDDPGLRGIKGEALVVRNPYIALNRPVRLMHPRYPLYIVPRADHIFMIGATQIEGAGNPGMSLNAAMELMSAAFTVHPSFADAEVIGLQTGIRPAYADNLPRIKIDGGRISCNGLFRHGFLLAPMMAQCVTDYLMGRDNKFMPLFMKDRQ